jgi:predicted PurR-regulated permease PerM
MKDLGLVVILTNQLENLGQNIENAIAKLNKSNDVISRQKAKVLQQAWDKYSKQLKIIVDGIGKIPLKKTLFSLSKVTLGVVAILTLTGLFFKLKNTPFGKTISDWISTIPNPFSDETTTENTGGGSNNQGSGKKYQGIDKNGNPIFN